MGSGRPVTAERPAVVSMSPAGPGQHERGRVVLVHGTMDQRQSFRQVAGNLPGWSVLGYDRRGWGTSRALGGTGTCLADHVRDLCELLAEAQPSTVVGHSYGGLIALCAAAQHPDLVTAVVAFEPPVRWSPWWPAEAPWERLARASDDPAMAAEGLLRAVLGDSGWGKLSQRSRDGLLADGPMLLTEMNDPSLDVPTFDPARLTVPVTTAAGTVSLPHHQEVARRIAAIAPNGRFVSIEGAGHHAHVTHPAQFARLILEGQG